MNGILLYSVYNPQVIFFLHMKRVSKVLIIFKPPTLQRPLASFSSLLSSQPPACLCFCSFFQEHLTPLRFNFFLLDLLIALCLPQMPHASLTLQYISAQITSYLRAFLNILWMTDLHTLCPIVPMAALISLPSTSHNLTCRYICSILCVRSESVNGT